MKGYKRDEDTMHIIHPALLPLARTIKPIFKESQYIKNMEKIRQLRKKQNYIKKFIFQRQDRQHISDLFNLLKFSMRVKNKALRDMSITLQTTLNQYIQKSSVCRSKQTLSKIKIFSLDIEIQKLTPDSRFNTNLNLFIDNIYNLQYLKLQIYNAEYVFQEYHKWAKLSRLKSLEILFMDSKFSGLYGLISDLTIDVIGQKINTYFKNLTALKLEFQDCQRLIRPILLINELTKLQTLEVKMNNCNKLISPTIKLNSMASLEKLHLDFSNCCNLASPILDLYEAPIVWECELRFAETNIDDETLNQILRRVNQTFRSIRNFVVWLDGCKNVQYPNIKAASIGPLEKVMINLGRCRKASQLTAIPPNNLKLYLQSNFLNFNYLKDFTMILDQSMISDETIVSIMEILNQYAQFLEYFKLSMEKCNNLVNIFASLGNLIYFKSLILKFNLCESLSSINIDVKNMPVMNEFIVQVNKCSNMKEADFSLDSILGLENLYFEMQDCDNVVNPKTILKNLTSLKILKFFYCSCKKLNLPVYEFQNLSMLTDLQIICNNSEHNKDPLIKFEECPMLQKTLVNINFPSLDGKGFMFLIDSIDNKISSASKFHLQLNNCFYMVNPNRTIANFLTNPISQNTIKLSKVRKLCLNLNKALSIDEDIYFITTNISNQLSNLEELTMMIQYCSMLEKPKINLFSLVNLKILTLTYIYCERMTSSTVEIGNLNRLQIWNLKYYQCLELEEVDLKLEQIRNIQGLNAEFNLVAFDDDSVSKIIRTIDNNLTSLEKLNFSILQNTKVSKPSIVILNMHRLQKIILDFGGCDYLETPKLILQKLKQLNEVSLSFSRCLKLGLPDLNFIDLEKLKKLDYNFSYTKIDDGSAVIITNYITNNMNYLEKLSLDFSYCQSLKEPVFDVSSLKDLHSLSINIKACYEMRDVKFVFGSIRENIKNLLINFSSCSELDPKKKQALKTFLQRQKSMPEEENH